MKRLACWLPLLAFLLLTGPVAAQDAADVSDDAVNEVARELFCPTCENTPLDVCPTQTCVDWREEIRIQLAAGLSPAEIRANFAARYGDHVLAEPPQRGFDLIAWLLPLFAVLGGGLFFARYLLNLRRPQPLTGPAPPRDGLTPPTEPHGDPLTGPAPPRDRHQDTGDYASRIEQELSDHP